MSNAINGAAVAQIFTARNLRPIHPLHALLLAFAPSMFVGAFLNDLAYASSAHIQWSNFASWLIVGGLIGGGCALLWSLIDLARDRAQRVTRQIVYAGLLATMFVFGFVNALVHSKDAWAIMPDAVWLSVVTVLLSLAAAWIGFSGLRTGERA